MLNSKSTIYQKTGVLPKKLPVFFVLIGLQNINLAAFVCAFKAHRRNSLVYSKDRAYKISKALGISANTASKYMARLKELGIIQPFHSCYRMIALKDILPILFPDYFTKEKHFFNHIRFFGGLEKKANFKYYKSQITFAFAETNFNQQQYFITKYQFLNEAGCNRFHRNMKRLRALYKKHGVNSLQALQRIIRPQKDIVTGKFHLSGLIGCSPSTAASLLRNWTLAGRIKRKIVVDFVKTSVSHAAFDSLKALGNKFIHPSSTGNGFFVNKGSIITLCSCY